MAAGSAVNFAASVTVYAFSKTAVSPCCHAVGLPEAVTQFTVEPSIAQLPPTQ